MRCPITQEDVANILGQISLLQVNVMNLASDIQLYRQDLQQRAWFEEQGRRALEEDVPVVEQTAEEEPQQDQLSSVKLEDEDGEDSIDELIERARIVVHRVTRIVTNQLE
jgi:hypothetical protein